VQLPTTVIMDVAEFFREHSLLVVPWHRLHVVHFQNSGYCH